MNLKKLQHALKVDSINWYFVQSSAFIIGEKIKELFKVLKAEEIPHLRDMSLHVAAVVTRDL